MGMNNIIMVKCPTCQRFKRFHEWVSTEQFTDWEFRNLVNMKLSGEIDYEMRKCNDCEPIS